MKNTIDRSGLISRIILGVTLVFLLPISSLRAEQPRQGKTQMMQPEAILKAKENSKLSPYTGYTREHWLEICEKLIAGILPYFEDDLGLPLLKGVPEESGHFNKPLEFVGGRKEAFERSMVLSAFYAAATGKDRVPGYEGSITRPYRDGMIRLTDPSGPAYFGPREQYEAFGTNLALSVLICPEYFWEPLTELEKNNLLKFFADLSEMVAYDCNHWFFHMVTVPLLDKYGHSNPRREYLTMIFNRLLGWYRGDGWFIDGGNFSIDYYNLWGFQLYNNVLTYYDAPWKKQFGPRVKQTTGRFLESFPYLYGRDGGSVPFGRSITYRFASISALAWATLNDNSTLPPGQSRRIASGCLKYFWEHGALSENGLLEPGFHGPNSVAAESYIDRGSPYWAAQAMAVLLIPEDDPFWTAPEEPMPADGAGGRLALPGAQVVMKVSPQDGEAKVYPLGQPIGHAGQWQRGIKYFQHSYSSYLGWCALGSGGPDLAAGRSGTSVDGKRWSLRRNPRPLKVDSHHSASIYDINMQILNPELEDFGQVITHTLIGESGEVHLFWHNSARPLYMKLGGYGISVAHGKKLKRTADVDDRLIIRAGRYSSAMEILDAPPGAIQVEELKPRQGWGHAHLFGGNGAFPYWQSTKPVPPNVPVVIYVSGARDRKIVRPELSLKNSAGQVGVSLEGTLYNIRVPY